MMALQAPCPNPNSRANTLHKPCGSKSDRLEHQISNRLSQNGYDVGRRTKHCTIGHTRKQLRLDAKVPSFLGGNFRGAMPQSKQKCRYTTQARGSKSARLENQMSKRLSPRGPARTAFRHAGTGALRGCQKQMALEPNGIRSRMHPPHYQKWPITRPLTETNSMYKHTLHGRSRTGASPRPFRLLGKTHTHTLWIQTVGKTVSYCCSNRVPKKGGTTREG